MLWRRRECRQYRGLGDVSLASEYAKNNIRFNAVAPGAVDTPLVKAIPKDFLMTVSPMGAISEAKDIADAVIYLTEARGGRLTYFRP
jgi:NAD(P)-dependent dehydrogenase (short-subunit alcohol dehydrogenase family)